MKWRVIFPQPVVDMPDHPKGRQIVTELIVHAPDADGARTHAIRVVSGDVSGLIVEPFTGRLGADPVVEVPC